MYHYVKVEPWPELPSLATLQAFLPGANIELCRKLAEAHCCVGRWEWYRKAVKYHSGLWKHLVMHPFPKDSTGIV